MPKALRLVFAGTPVFAERALDRILGSAHRVVGVLTQPDRPSGRGQKLNASAVKARAVAAGLRVLQPASLRDPAVQQALRALEADVIVVAAYGLILPQAVLDIAPLGCLNIHASLLPRWRGAAPIVRAIQAGDVKTGVCIMKMEAGLDTGPIGLTLRTPLSTSDTAGGLHDRLAELGAQAILVTLDALAGVGTHAPLRFMPQASEGVTYAHKITKREAPIDWQWDATTISRHIRAFDPQPGGTSALARQPEAAIRFFEPVVLAAAASGSSQGEPARVLDVSTQGLVIGCGRGSIRIGALQRAGGRRLPVADFIRGHRIEAGDLLVRA